MSYKINLEVVKKYMEDKNVLGYEMSNLMSVNPGYFSRVMSGKRNPGIKFIKGLMDLGIKPNIFFCKECCQVATEEGTLENVLNYMNTFSMTSGKEYSKYDLINIRNSINLEFEDRKQQNLYIQGNTKEGRNKTNERAAQFAQNEYKLSVSARDIALYKRCVHMEAKDSTIIKSVEEEHIEKD